MAPKRIDLDAVDALCEAATPGPWHWDNTPTGEWGHQPPDLTNEAGAWIVSSWGHDADGVSVEDPDANLIAQSRTLLPALAAELRDLRAKVDAVRDLHRPMEGRHRHFCEYDGQPLPCHTLAALGEVAGRDEEDG